MTNFLEDAPWEGCPHGNYEFKCVGCWEALIGQSKKATNWQEALREAAPLLIQLRAEVALLTPKERDERQIYMLEQVDQLVKKLDS